MNCLFGGNSCTWVLILVIVFLLSQNCGNDYSRCGSNCGCGCSNDYNTGNNGCGCGCGC